MIILRKNSDPDSKESLFSAFTRVNAVDRIYGDNKPLGRRFILEVMKVIEMYDSELNDNTSHWIKKSAQAMVDIMDTKIFQPQSLFSVLDWPRGNYVLGDNVMLEIKSKYRNPEDFVERCVMTRLLTESRNDDVKYSSVIPGRSSIKTSPSDYVNICKFIMLSVTGQIDPDNFDYWSMRSTLKGMDIDYDRLNIKVQRSIDRKLELSKTIAKCVLEVMRYDNGKLSELLD